ncbi:MAG: hypothetical protein FD163_836 [Hyphomonadaceae bacterium]|nr:MAG: hypothetical protein FD128_2371 [Hyphomonadaceae bacterium]KAF0186168.1 MAG: hypothetical protein FD163_836 [Hyphomonadaceae bacterium]
MKNIDELEFLLGAQIEEISFVADYVELKNEFGIIRLLGFTELTVAGCQIADGDDQFEHEIRKLIGATLTCFQFVEDEVVQVLLSNNVIAKSTSKGFEIMHFVYSKTGQVLVW